MKKNAYLVQAGSWVFLQNHSNLIYCNAKHFVFCLLSDVYQELMIKNFFLQKEITIKYE